MFKAISFSAVIAAVAAVTMAPAPAEARPYNGGYYQAGNYYQGDRSEYFQEVRDHRHRGYRGDRGRYYRGDRGRGYNRGYNRGRCRDKGDGGTVIGAIAGGLLGNQVAGRGDRTLGTIIGAGGGAVAGRLIDRDC